jgi:KDO2-lipid IV(A) lauroyltransferase
MKTYLENIEYHIISGFFRLLGCLPRVSARRISTIIGRIWFVADRRHREVALQNLTLAFGATKSPAQIRHLGRAAFSHMVCILFEIGWLARISKRDFSKYFYIHGLHHLQAAYKKGQGVLILTGHVGNWEMMPLAAAMLGYPISAVYRPLDFKPLDRFFIDFRGRYGAKLHAKKNAMRPILKGLKNKELIGILLDQNTHRNAGVFVDFFGRPACTNEGLALLALRTETPVVPLFCMREGDRFRVEFGQMLPLVRTGDKEKDITINTRQYNRALEEIIRRYPEQWFWVHQRWKTRPKNASVNEKPIETGKIVP